MDDDERMLTDDISLDDVLQDVAGQIELLEAIEDRNPLFAEQLRVFREASATILELRLQLQRLEELVDWDALPDDGLRPLAPWSDS